MSKKKTVPAAAVRAWFAEAQPADVTVPGTRGKLAPDTIAAFHAANPTKRYVVAGDAQRRTVTIQVPATDSRGRNIKKTVTVFTDEARKLLGHDSGLRGRFSAADKARLAELVKA